MDLAELKFVVNTDDLVDAAKKIDALAVAVSKVNKPITDAALKSEKLAKAQAEVEEKTAKAALAQLKLEEAQGRSNTTTSKSVSVLERQNMILGYMAEGLSKGQASYMATAKAAGALDGELKELVDTLKIQRTLQGSEPFDKSIGLMQKLTNETKIVNEVNELFNRNLGLTEKQMTDLAREKERLTALYNFEKRSLSGLNSEYEKIIQKTAETNRANNARTESMKAQIKAQSDAAKANAYLADADARLAAALSDTNKALDKQATDALVKYEKALKQTGMASDDAAAKLAVAKKQFEGIAEKKQADRLQYLARAISVQMGDVGISLASGMNPLLVMIQQGDQIRGAIQQAGASGKELERAMAGAATQIATSFLQTGQAIGGFFVNAIKSAGKAMFDLPISIATSAFGALTGNVETSAAAFDRLKIAAISFGKVGIVAIIATLAALGKGLYDVIKQEDALTTQLVLTGASLGVNTTLANQYAKSLNNVGISSSASLNTIAAMAKEGGFLATEITMVATAANNLKFAGIAIEDTVKQFSKLKEKPVEALIEIAKNTGLIKPEVVALVSELEQQGKTSQAAAVAMKAYADVTIEQKDRLKEELNGFAVFMKTLGSSIANFFDDVFKNLFRKADPSQVIEKQIQQINDALKGGFFVGGVSASALKKQKDLLVEELMRLDQIKVAELTRNNDNIRTANALGEWQKLSLTNLDKEKKAELDIANIRKVGLEAKKSEAEIEKLIAAYKEKNKPAKTTAPPERAIVVPTSRDIAIVQKDFNEQLRLAEGFAKDERSILKARFDAGLIDRAEFITSDTALLVRSEEQQLAVIEDSRAKYKTAYETQAKLLRDALGTTKDEENRRVLQTSINNLDKDFAEFNSTLDDTKVKIGSAFGAREQVALLEFQKVAFESTKTFREYAKSQEDATANRRIDAEVQTQLLNAYGAEAVKIRAVADETKRQTAEISKFTIAQQRAFEAYQKTLNNPNATGSERGAAYTAYVTAMENANNAISISRVSIENAGTDAVVAYYKQEYNRINNGITDGIVTALFEGGKAGSKKLRDLIVAELKKPITIMVKALVDVGMNALIGGGSRGSSFAESIVGSFLKKQIGGIAVGGTTLGAAAGAFGQGVLSGFSMGAPVASMGSATSASFNAGAAAAPVAGAAAGLAANKIISQDYEISKTMTNLQNVATVAAAFIPGLGPLVALGVGVVSGLANRAFGMKAKEITGEGIVGTLTTQGADVKAFEEWFQKGGWFRSNKSGRSYSAISSSLQEYLNLSLSGLTASTKAYAAVLGLEAKDIDSVTKSINLNLKGLSAEDRQKKIDEALSGFGNELAKKLGFESFDALQKLGEEVLKERYALESQLLTLQGDTVALRAREREQIYETNQALFDQVKALEDAKSILEEKTRLEQELALLEGRTTQLAIDRSKLLSNENRLVYDQINAIKDKQKADEEAAKAMEKLTSITTTVVDEINRLRGVNTSQSGLESQFAILTAQARSGDLNALAQLPEITKGLEQIAASTAVNATDIIFARARLAQSLQDTLGYTGGFTASATTSVASIGSVSTSGAAVTSNVSAASSNQELLAALVTEIQGLRAEVRADVSHNAKTAKILERVNQDGESLTITTLV